MNKLITYLFFSFFLINCAQASIECNFQIDRLFEAKSGKFNKGKIYDDEKNQRFTIKNLNKLSNKTYAGILNGAGHINRNVTVIETDRIVSISQSDAHNSELFAHYTIFKNQKKNNKFMSSMYQVYPSNWGFGAIYLYYGYCNINKWQYMEKSLKIGKMIYLKI